MNLIVSRFKDPGFNLAVEELLLKNSSEEYTFLYINDSSVITGKHQCTHREINTRYITENKIPVLRRLSGGGTVYHDPGNLNFTFILNSESGKQIDFARYSKPVLDYLRAIGLDAVLHGSDIRIGGMKLSGNAEHVYHNRVLHHGTILFNAALDTLGNCLRKDVSAYSTRAVVSNPARVINLSQICSEFSGIDQFLDSMLSFLVRYFKGSLIELPDKVAEEALMLSGTKYSTWDWNYAYGPEYEFKSRSEILSAGTGFTLNVVNGIIRKVWSDNDLHNSFPGILTGCRHMPGDISEKLISSGITGIDAYEFF